MMVPTTMGSQAMVSSEVIADNGATKENAQEEAHVPGGNPIPTIKRGPEPEALAKAMAKARATTKGKGTLEDK